MYISGVTMIWSKTLDPNSPDYKWEDGGSIAGYEGPDDFINPIDPGAFLDPTTGRLWLTYGSYYGFTRVVELDPTSGKRLHPDQTPDEHRHQPRSNNDDSSRRLVLSPGH